MTDTPEGRWVLVRNYPGDTGHPLWHDRSNTAWGITGLPSAAEDTQEAALSALVPLVRQALNAAEAPPSPEPPPAPSGPVGQQDPDRLPMLYIASRSQYGPQWQSLRAGIADRATIVSTWIDESGPGESSDLVDLWDRCIGEVAKADALIAVHYPGDTWKGAFIEIGAALALGKPVFVVGDPPGSWRHHARVRRIGRNDQQAVMPAVEAALAALRPEEPGT